LLEKLWYALSSSLRDGDWLKYIVEDDLLEPAFAFVEDSASHLLAKRFLLLNLINGVEGIGVAHGFMLNIQIAGELGRSPPS